MAQTEIDTIKARPTIPSGPLIDNTVLNDVIVTGLTYCKRHRQIPVGIDQATGSQVIGLGETKVVVPPDSQPLFATNQLCNQLHCGRFGENCAAKKLADATGQTRSSWTDLTAQLVRHNKSFK